MVATHQWRTVTHPRRWRTGMRVIGYQHPNGRMYRVFKMDLMSRIESRELYQNRPKRDWKDVAKTFHGVLIKNEWKDEAIVYPRYTVLCDDGRVRKFQFIRPE